MRRGRTGASGAISFGRESNVKPSTQEEALVALTLPMGKIILRKCGRRALPVRGKGLSPAYESVISFDHASFSPHADIGR